MERDGAKPGNWQAACIKGDAEKRNTSSSERDLLTLRIVGKRMKSTWETTFESWASLFLFRGINIGYNEREVLL
jgi:hypothetical protein